MSPLFLQDLISDGFERIERDDRLLDVFPAEDREKGIELWDKWTNDKVEIIRIHVPKREKGMKRFILDRTDIEQALVCNKTLSLG